MPARKRSGLQSLILGIVAVAAVGVGLWMLARRPVTGGDEDPSWRPARLSDKWTHIVIHHSATDVGGAERFDASHRGKGWDELGYHFVIGNGTDTPDGAVEVGSRWLAQKRGAHCKTPDGYYNEHGVGICLVGNLENAPPTKAQLESLGRLARFLCRALRIGPANITTHSAVTGKTECPGRHFDLNALRGMVGR